MVEKRVSVRMLEGGRRDVAVNGEAEGMLYLVEERVGLRVGEEGMLSMEEGGSTVRGYCIGLRERGGEDCGCSRPVVPFL